MTSDGSTFDWVVPDVLGAMARPYDLNHAFERLQERRVSVVVTLTETPLNMAFVEEFGFEYHHIPVGNFRPPTQAQVAEFVEIVERAKAQGKRVVVHCLAGMGRTGTMAAAYLVSLGRSAAKAMAEIRRLRPGSIETPEQEDAVSEYEQSLRKQS